LRFGRCRRARAVAGRGCVGIRPLGGRIDRLPGGRWVRKTSSSGDVCQVVFWVGVGVGSWESERVSFLASSSRRLTSRRLPSARPSQAFMAEGAAVEGGEFSHGAFLRGGVKRMASTRLRSVVMGPTSVCMRTFWSSTLRMRPVSSSPLRRRMRPVGWALLDKPVVAPGALLDKSAVAPGGVFEVRLFVAEVQSKRRSESAVSTGSSKTRPASNSRGTVTSPKRADSTVAVVPSKLMASARKMPPLARTTRGARFSVAGRPQRSRSAAGIFLYLASVSNVRFQFLSAAISLAASGWDSSGWASRRIAWGRFRGWVWSGLF